jgi:hypothetical protein
LHCILHLRKWPGSWFWGHSSSLLAHPWNSRIVNVHEDGRVDRKLQLKKQFCFLEFQLKVLKMTTSQFMLSLNIQSRKWVENT